MQKKRRRVFKASTAKDYDRTADSPILDSVGDETREVILDPELDDDAPTGVDFWKEQEPPHHG